MKKVILYALLIVLPVSFSISCVGYVDSSYTGVGRGIHGSPYGPHGSPSVRVGVYGGGYYR